MPERDLTGASHTAIDSYTTRPHSAATAMSVPVLQSASGCAIETVHHLADRSQVASLSEADQLRPDAMCRCGPLLVTLRDQSPQLRHDGPEPTPASHTLANNPAALVVQVPSRVHRFRRRLARGPCGYRCLHHRDYAGPDRRGQVGPHRNHRA